MENEVEEGEEDGGASLDAFFPELRTLFLEYFQLELPQYWLT